MAETAGVNRYSQRGSAHGLRRIGWERALAEIDRVVKFSRPKHGIAFTMPVGAFIGSGGTYDYKFSVQNGGGDSMYRAVFVIVDKGKEKRSWTWPEKRGPAEDHCQRPRLGDPRDGGLLNMEIEPEKEIVLMLTPVDLTERIVTAVREGLRIDEPGNGIIWVQPVNETYGILR